MKWLILALIIPWIFFALFYNRLLAFKKSNAAMKDALDKRERELKKFSQKKYEIETLLAKIEEYKSALTDLQLEHTTYKKITEEEIGKLRDEIKNLSEADHTINLN